jgi:hypothetical protein
MKSHRLANKLCGAIAGVLAAAMPMTAHAILVATGDGTQNTTQGTMPDGWNYVGSTSNASGVYLGDGWVLTVVHIGTASSYTSFTLPGYGTYQCNGNVIPITDPVTHNPVDLQLFQLSYSQANPLPDLPPLNIASSTPAAGTSIYMVGYGYSDRAAQPTYYDVTPDPYTNPNYNGAFVFTPTDTPGPDSFGGFQYDLNHQYKRWGTTVTTTDPDPNSPTYGQTTESINIGAGATTTLVSMFYNGLTDYENGGDSPEQGMVTEGDSGGGVFDASNTLVALNAYAQGLNGQPDDTVIFGDEINPIDLAPYQAEILADLPEPSAGLAGTAIILPLLARRRRARK